MPNFFSRCNRPVTAPVPVGGATAPIYEERISDDVRGLVIVGQTNLFEYVQASKDDTLIYNLLDRFVKGDITALLAKKGQFLDCTGMPSTLAEAQQLMINATERFNRLPSDQRAKFKDVHDYVQKVATADMDGLKEIFGITDTVVNSDVKDGDTVA